MNKHFRQIMTIGREAGLTGTRLDLRHRHPRLISDQGTLVFPGTPGDVRSMRNMESCARRLARGTL